MWGYYNKHGIQNSLGNKLANIIYLSSTINNRATLPTLLTKILKRTNITRKTMINLVGTLVLPIFSYISEALVDSKSGQKISKAWRIWWMRRMLWIPSTDNSSGDNSFHALKVTQELQKYYIRSFKRIINFFAFNGALLQ